MDLIRKFLGSGKPLVGIRTASHAFSLRKGEKLPDGDADWQGFDHEVLGCNYNLHHNEKLKTAGVLRGLTGLELTRLLPIFEKSDEAVQRQVLAALAQSDNLGGIRRDVLTALVGKLAWMSGLRRAEAPTRATAPIVARDLRGLVKVNPIATWTDADVAGYVADHDVPVNPLLAQGYLSIGCRPCTQPVAPGADPRSGRWAGSDKTECGLHL